MINKTYKIINNKFSRFFKFIFFLRYLFLIFFVAIVLFLFIPQFFDYQKKEEKIRSYLSSIYGINIISMESVNFYSLPVPHLKIDNLTATYITEDINLNVKNLLIYPKFLSIYNYENFKVRKIKLDNHDIELDFRDTKLLLNKIYKLKNNLYLKNLNLKIKNSNNKIIELKKINFYNYGYKKNKIKGEVFEKKFIINLKEDFQKIDFNISNAGIYFQLIFLNDEQNFTKGNFKGKVLRSNLKFDYNFDGSSINIENFFLRDKNLSLNSSGVIDVKPFFKINLISEIQNINSTILRKLNINHILNLKDFIKRFNSQNKILFKSKKFQKNFINRLEINTNLAYGRLNISKDIYVSNTNIKCKGNINLLDDYPVLNFVCMINSKDQTNLLKKIKVNFKNRNKPLPLDLKIEGNLNILNNKINFDNIEMNDNYKASREDLKFLKSAFENIFFDDNFVNIFSLTKLRKFILEIS